ncbi:hypothetical protein F4778DRAFT_66092 [Xylariomycetidae sp. FL2044]|nr:hypothetical protein F4778DRAFT_66092 [Xylariomycetidae sp. FL2044]
MNLPSTKLHLKMLKEECTCRHCSPAKGQKFRRCKRQDLLEVLAMVAADVLVLSLYVYPARLLIQQHGAERLISLDGFPAAMQAIMENPEPTECQLQSLHRWAFALTGHDEVLDDITENKWIMSSSHGQAVWPAIYATNAVSNEGYMAPAWALSIIMYNGTSSSRVRELPQGGGGTVGLPEVPGAVKQPRNLSPDLRLEWEVLKGDGVLYAGLGFEKGSVNASLVYAIAPPPMIFSNLASALLMEACDHDAATCLAEADPFCVGVSLTNPIAPQTPDHSSGIATVSVVAVDCAEDLRMFSLTCGGWPLPAGSAEEVGLLGLLLRCLQDGELSSFDSLITIPH